MPEVVTTCSKCGCEFAWNTSYQEMPDCPNCGYNPNQKFREADVPRLIQMLVSSDRYINSGAAAELGKRGDKRAVEPLIAALKNDDTKAAAVIALGELGNESAVEPLITLMKSGEGPFAVAAEELIKIGSSNSIKAVLDEINNLPNPEAVIDALENKGESSIKPLFTLRKSQWSIVSKYANKALARLGWKPTEQIEQIEPSPKSEDIEPLIDALKNQDSNVRYEAASALSRIGDHRSVEPLLDVLKDPESSVRRVVTEAIIKIGTPAAIERLITELKIELKDENVDIRKNAASTLAKTEDPLAVEPLIDALKDEDDGVRQTASWAFAYTKIGDSRAVEPLIDALRDEANNVRMYAAQALDIIGDPRSVEPLIHALEDRYESVREKAASALSKIGDSRAVEPLIDALKDKNPGVREYAAWALKNIGDSSAVEQLIFALRDQAINVRRVSALALAEIRDSSAVDPLIDALKDEAGGVRAAAANALGLIGDPRAVKPLNAALNDNFWFKEYINYWGSDLDSVRKNILDAIERITELHPEVNEEPEEKDEPEKKEAAEKKEVPDLKPKKGCFIATATMGEYNHPTVLFLREFRDEYLERSKWGRKFINIYYNFSPYPAALIKKHKVFRRISYFLVIRPLVAITKKLLWNDRLRTSFNRLKR